MTIQHITLTKYLEFSVQFRQINSDLMGNMQNTAKKKLFSNGNPTHDIAILLEIIKYSTIFRKLIQRSAMSKTN